MYYFVVGHPSSDRRVEMLTFCRAEGLDAYLVPDDNALLRKIIVLPGYRDLSEKSSSEIKALEAKIKQVGKKWKGNKPGKNVRETETESSRRRLRHTDPALKDRTR